MSISTAWQPDTVSGDGAFYEDAEIRSLQSRALVYISAGVPVHLRGPAGMGKTTLALRIAGRLGRPVSFLTGDRWLTRAELVGREVGQTEQHVVDRYVSRVRRTESHVRADWQDAILAEAMRKGHVLVYDEFTRAPPEANAVLLPVLEERVLVFHDPLAGRSRLEAHPGFRMILTSNPHDYVGVEHAPDALADRIVTFDLEELPVETEAGIIAARTGLDPGAAAQIAALVRALRHPDLGAPPALPASLRTALLIGRLAAHQGAEISAESAEFLQICADVLKSRHRPGTAADDSFETLLGRALRACCQPEIKAVS